MKRNKINSESGACQAKTSKQAGSTIIAVLAAMLFIGVVTASMVKNTGSQSAASIGYSTMQTMSSTARSGMVATETYFKNNSDGVVAGMNAYLEAERNGELATKRPFIFGTAKNNKQQLATNQYFTSQIHNMQSTGGAVFHPKYISFDVYAGRGQRGKDLKKSIAYYGITNSENVTIEDNSDFGGMNSFCATDNAKVDAGNSGAVFHGHATFEKGLYIQNNKPVKFVKDENGEGSVFVKERTEILNNTTVKFEVDAYFDDYVNIQNITNDDVFAGKVGFNSNFFTTRATTRFGGDVWFNGDFKGPYGNYNSNLKLVSDNADNNFYYTDNISMKSNAVCSTCPPSGPCTQSNPDIPAGSPGAPGVAGTCCPHSCTHNITLSEQIEGFGNINPAIGYHGSNITNIYDSIGIGSFEQRKEPDIDVANIAEGKLYLNVTNDNVLSGSNLNGDKLQEFYEQTKDDPAYAQYYQNGHLLLKVPTGATVNTNGGTFDGKVIFNIEGQLNGDASFYNSGPDASTLVYVGSSGVLNQFGAGVDGTFRGLVYIDSSNHEQQSFAWGAGSEIQGAVILKGGNLFWNANSSVMDIYRNDDVLRNFAFLKTDSSTETTKTTTITNTTDGVKLRAFGYYFF